MLMDCAGRMGPVVHEHDIYREIVSGESIEARPQMQRLLKAVEMRTYTAVPCIELERLSRGNGAGRARIPKAFQFSNTKITTLDKTYGLASDDGFDGEFFEFGLFMSRREYKTIKRRLLRGRMQSQQEGYFIGSALPFGYGKIKNPEGRGHILVPNEQAPILQMIFRRYAEGDLLAGIVQDLNAAGVQTASSLNAKWSTNRVRDMLRNRVYIGEIDVEKYARNRRMEDGRIIETKRRNPERQQAILASYGNEKRDNADGETPSFLQAEIAKKDKMMERVDELYELGGCSRTKYLERSQKPQAQKAELMKRLEEVERRISERDSKRENAVPILTKVLDEYHTLDVKGENDLPKMIVECIAYRKRESGGDIGPGLDFRLLI